MLLLYAKIHKTKANTNLSWQVRDWKFVFFFFNCDYVFHHNLPNNAWLSVLFWMSKLMLTPQKSNFIFFWHLCIKYVVAEHQTLSIIKANVNLSLQMFTQFLHDLHVDAEILNRILWSFKICGILMLGNERSNDWQPSWLWLGQWQCGRDHPSEQPLCIRVFYSL